MSEDKLLSMLQKSKPIPIIFFNQKEKKSKEVFISQKGIKRAFLS